MDSGMLRPQVVNTFLCLEMPSTPDDEFYGVKSLRRVLSAPALLTAMDLINHASEGDSVDLPSKKAIEAPHKLDKPSRRGQKFRPCKGQRLRYRNLIKHTMDRIAANPAGFDFTLLESQIPHSVTKYAPLKQNFMTQMQEFLEVELLKQQRQLMQVMLKVSKTPAV